MENTVVSLSAEEFLFFCFTWAWYENTTIFTSSNVQIWTILLHWYKRVSSMQKIANKTHDAGCLIRTIYDVTRSCARKSSIELTRLFKASG